MSVSLRATPSLTYANAANLTLPITGSAVNGDLMIMFVGSGALPSLPAGWTALENANTNSTATLVAYKVCAGDSGTNVTVTISSSQHAGCVVVLAGTSLWFAPVRTVHQAAGTGAITNGLTGLVGIALYFSIIRASSITLTLSRGTTDNTRSGDTSTSSVVGHESFSTDDGGSLTVTPSSGTAAIFSAILSVFENPLANGEIVDDDNLVIAATDDALSSGHVYKGRLAKTSDTTGVA